MKIKCLVCCQIIESKNVHDRVNCECGMWTIDGKDAYHTPSEGKFIKMMDIPKYRGNIIELVKKYPNFQISEHCYIRL